MKLKSGMMLQNDNNVNNEWLKNIKNLLKLGIKWNDDDSIQITITIGIVVYKLSWIYFKNKNTYLKWLSIRLF